MTWIGNVPAIRSPENTLGVKRSQIKVTSHKNIVSVRLYTLVSAGFFSVVIAPIYKPSNNRNQMCSK